ncbi:hypothetical protein DPT59_17060 [Salmonella enterica subsp. enterica serovar Stanleyville]|uniref:Uncharacterized protein n=1 Tax=Salmonella enterica subsp. enterica serovar Stanleyville TaxID=286782 RepID=A0A5W1VAN8_SALET|nr:hypothetical protein [Salmonella enterica subsp. enterica serovar Stanleyville]ECC3666649.1 hypothetical protein [Salmonella enterica subsp. enterica]EBQ9566347.1 hypothetical protein [Salmonella enterica subsp. enterica serovar Stanleyville]EBQ9944945.1 hypothetical protein [Salmonella enterica subsp. enterica serovar Stanleyville]EBS3794108.1 hypothetical protein [Salmonella enterica subsp. enterica serovar Stanleyville]
MTLVNGGNAGWRVAYPAYRKHSFVGRISNAPSGNSLTHGPCDPIRQFPQLTLLLRKRRYQRFARFL